MGELAESFFQKEVNGDQLKLSCHSPHLAKIQEMKGISDPLLPMVIYTFC